MFFGGLGRFGGYTKVYPTYVGPSHPIVLVSRYMHTQPLTYVRTIATATLTMTAFRLTPVARRRLPLAARVVGSWLTLSLRVSDLATKCTTARTGCLRAPALNRDPTPAGTRGHGGVCSDEGVDVSGACAGCLRTAAPIGGSDCYSGRRLSSFSTSPQRRRVMSGPMLNSRPQAL